MKYRVYTNTFRELQSICDWVDLVNDLKRTVEAFSQLSENSLCSLGGSLPVWTQFQEDPIPRFRNDLSPFGISMALHASLGFDQIFANTVKHFFLVCQNLINNVEIRSAREVLQKTKRLSSKHDLIWCGPCAKVP